MDLKKRAKVGMVGCGFYAQNHLHAWADLRAAGSDLVAVCDIDSGRAEAGIDAVREWLGAYPANTASDLDRVDHLVPTTVTSTIAEGIASSKPTRVVEALRAVRDSGGSIVAVTEEEIVTALGTLARKGLYVEPTSAAAGAGLTQLLASGVIRPGESTVLVLTGTGLKASERIGELLGLKARDLKG